MGILNVTPDSFSDGGKFIQLGKALSQVQYMENNGADIIDIGGESTRPGAVAVSLEEEINRTIPVIEAIRKISNISISIDTYKSEVAEKALLAGADFINDISGLTFDSRMMEIVKKFDVPVVLMHIKGTPNFFTISIILESNVKPLISLIKSAPANKAFSATSDL
jgi:dihydropteroate synthase